MKFIQLHYYSFNKTYPEKSIRTNKPFFLNPNDIVKMTPYSPSKKKNIKAAPFFSTIISLRSGEEVEVTETVDDIVKLVKKSI